MIYNMIKMSFYNECAESNVFLNNTKVTKAYSEENEVFHEEHEVKI